jgi:hypothetical protein
VLHTDATKVDRDVAHIVMVVHVCCKLLFLMFHLFFSDVCCKCVYLDCICFHTYDTSVLSGCCVCLQWFQVFQIHVSFVFSRMLQLLHLDVSKLDRMCISLLVFHQSHLGVRRGKAEAIPTGAGEAHVLVGGRNTWAGKHGTRDGGSSVDVWMGG